jgi:hypothetical protein
VAKVQKVYTKEFKEKAVKLAQNSGKSTAQIARERVALVPTMGKPLTALFKSEALFGLYSIGLAIGFFAYFVVSLTLFGKKETGGWMED